ncbi:coiled-coil domain-containing protein 86-like [Ascaphus truei]|uniref:coiled-coil domain-containing protein 86-like n=1 Tax=Ascaphus truei TaxID=8439 RepID=UPI003F59DD2E
MEGRKRPLPGATGTPLRRSKRRGTQGQEPVEEGVGQEPVVEGVGQEPVVEGVGQEPVVEEDVAEGQKGKQKVMRREETGGCHERPRGKPKSGRVWKDLDKKRFSYMVNDRPLRTSWDVKMRARQEKRLLRDFAQQLKDEQQREREEKKRRQEENLTRRLENERKAEVVQVIRNPSKLKRANKKQLRRIEKRDTLTLSQGGTRPPKRETKPPSKRPPQRETAPSNKRPPQETADPLSQA